MVVSKQTKGRDGVIQMYLLYTYINSILAIIYLNKQVLNKQVLKPD